MKQRQKKANSKRSLPFTAVLFYIIYYSPEIPLPRSTHKGFKSLRAFTKEQLFNCEVAQYELYSLAED